MVVLVGILLSAITLFLVFQDSIRQWMYEIFIDRYISDSTVDQIISDEVKDLGKYILLDCREPEEYKISHLHKAEFLGYENPNFSILQNFNVGDSIILYCSVGHRSQIMAKELSKKGFEHVYNLQGGIFQWIYEDRKIYREDEITEEIHAYSPKWGRLLSKGKKVY